MIISDCRNEAGFSNEDGWSRLQRFRNVTFTSEQIKQLHKLPTKSKYDADVRKQATQIRQCLAQAREYYVASTAVSLATRPTLHYYSTMSLALAEILLKQTGDSSLDRAREQHRHHGLTFQDLGASGTDEPLEQAAKRLVARPLVKAGNTRVGTFELWHQSARGTPVVGKVTRPAPGGGTFTTIDILAVPNDTRMPLLPEAGISLLDCLKCIPAMSGYLERLDLHSNTYRGVAKKNERTDFTTLSFVVHPGAPMPERVFEQVTWPATQMEQLQWIEFPGGGAVNITIPKGHDHPHWTGQQPQLPAGATMSVDDTRFWYRSEPLNEFGFLYTALFIAGNYARYYPDRWIVDVEHSAPLALAIEELLHIADERIPWLISSELERRYYVRGELTA